jgi:hypothetical protein
LTDPGDTVADRVEAELGAEVRLGGGRAVGGADNGDAVHGDTGVAFLGGEDATREAFEDDLADAEDVIERGWAGKGHNERVGVGAKPTTREEN